MSKLKSNLNCMACGTEYSVTCHFKKPSFGQRGLVSGTCQDCDSLNRYSIQLVEGKKFHCDPIECEMSPTGKARYQLRTQKLPNVSNADT